MNMEEIRECCLRKPGAEESFPFGEETLVFKVGGKIFLIASLTEGNQFNVKCDPERAIELREGPGGTPMLSVVDPRATARRPSAAVWPGGPPVKGSTMDMTPRGDERALWNGRLGGGGLGSW